MVEIDLAGKGWLAPVDKRIRNAMLISDLGGAEKGELVLAEPAGRSPRSGLKVTQVLGEPLAPRAFSLIAIHKHGIPNVFSQEMLDEAERTAKLPLSPDHREDLRHLPQAFGHARRARRIMLQNVALSLAIVIGLMPLALFGVLGLAAVVLVHEVAEVFVIANGVRAGRTKPLASVSTAPAPAPVELTGAVR